MRLTVWKSSVGFGKPVNPVTMLVVKVYRGKLIDVNVTGWQGTILALGLFFPHRK